MPEKKKNPLEKFLSFVDAFQQKHPVLAFPYGVIKKYGDDQAGYQGALITYYGFLSLFPLLLVATSVIDMVTQNNPELRQRLLDGITSYIPVIGDQIQTSIHTSSKSGIALFIGLVIAFYGARGIADIIQNALNHVWEVPRQKRPGFPKGPLKSLGIIAGGGLGFLAATVLSGYATTILGSSIGFRLLPILLSMGILFCTFTFIFQFASSAKHSHKDVFVGAIIAAVVIQLLQIGGTYLIGHQLHNLQGLYGQFALVLAILFWLYLQAQVFLYAAEVNAVRSLKLWPRSITQKPLTRADLKAFKLYAKRETFQAPDEQVSVEFSGNTTASK